GPGNRRSRDHNQWRCTRKQAPGVAHGRESLSCVLSSTGCSRAFGTIQRSNCRLRKRISKGTMAHFSHDTQADRINSSKLTQSKAQPTSVIVPLKPTSSEASGYSRALTRRRSTLRRVASSNSKQRMAVCQVSLLDLLSSSEVEA